MAMKRYIPNLLSILRLLCVIPLTKLILEHRGFVIWYFSFWGLWLFCGVSDALDGALARRWKVFSPFGALLDTIADIVILFPLGYVFLPYVHPFAPHAIIWICAILVVRLISIFIGAAKFHTFTLLHTRLNKLTGILLYLYPLLATLYGPLRPTIPICIFASLATIEELLILCTSHTLDRDVSAFREICS